MSKTASLFSAACQVGGLSAGAKSNQIQALKSFGTNFGMAFQLVDDAIDYSSNLKVMGKNVGCLLYTSPSPRDAHESRMPSSA